MDFGLREWLYILGPVFIAGVLLHGYWRMRQNRNSLKMSLDQSFVSEVGSKTGEDDLGMFKAELPNGGARVKTIPQQTTLNLDEDVPVLMNTVNQAVVDQAPISAVRTIKSTSNERRDVLLDDEVMVAEKTVAETALENSTTATKTSAVASTIKTPEPAIEIPEKFIVIYIIAVNEQFQGQDLLELLVEQDMKFGEMDIFHRFGDPSGESRFSLVNAVEPGTFDLNTMDQLATPGISLFMRVHELLEPVQAFDEMIELAQTLAEELGGEVKDESRSVMTAQTIEHSRLDIRQFQHKYR